MTTTSSDALALLAQVATFAQDPRFAFQLKELVQMEEKHQAYLVRQVCYVQQLRDADPSDVRVRRLLELHRRRGRNFGPREWIPDEYQAHEDFGLVHCQHHDINNPRFDMRTLTMMPAGDALAKELLERQERGLAVAA